MNMYILCVNIYIYTHNICKAVPLHVLHIAAAIQGLGGAPATDRYLPAAFHTILSHKHESPSVYP